MTAPTTEEVVSTTDLDEFDGLIHAYCGYCLPGGPRTPRYGELYTGLCGKPAIAGPRPSAASAPPRSACPKCVELVQRDVGPCGHVWIK